MKDDCEVPTPYELFRRFCVEAMITGEVTETRRAFGELVTVTLESEQGHADFEFGKAGNLISHSFYDVDQESYD